jgi:hypothetical protein
MVSYLISKDTRYWPMLHGFCFKKTNSTQNAPVSNISVSGLDKKKSNEIGIILQMPWPESKTSVRQKYRFAL